MGNGKIDGINDIIYVDIHKFDKLKTVEMAVEIESINKKMLKQDKKYILIGPGRWGTRDNYLGIPVNWGQISNARVIVEISLDDFPLDSSLGSHFFHNVTSMNIGYLSINSTKSSEYINWDVLKRQKLIDKTNYFRHIRFNKPLTVFMDGRKRTSLILNN